MRRPWEAQVGPALSSAVAQHLFDQASPSIGTTPHYSQDVTAAITVVSKLRDDVANGKRPAEVLDRLGEEIRSSRFWGPNDADAAEDLCRAALKAVDLNFQPQGATP